MIASDIEVQEEPVKHLIEEVITNDRFNAEEIVIVVDSPLSISDSESTKKTIIYIKITDGSFLHNSSGLDSIHSRLFDSKVASLKHNTPYKTKIYK